ncbi:MAG: polyprenyl diphosphate synthase [Halomonadaceae bacterium]|nr:MAG: polyprenyl diphosphate synthase [Halomonadaceae bacterium]
MDIMAAVQITNRTSETASTTPLFTNAVRPQPLLPRGDRRPDPGPVSASPLSPKLAQELDQVKDLMIHSLGQAHELPATQASRYQIDTGGGLLRARLALISGDHFGASADYRIASAAACELMHNASLVHDDLCDGDILRRGKATVWHHFNRQVALCAGDLLMCAAFMATTEVASPRHSQQLSRCLARHTRTVITGQSLEVAPEPATRPSLGSYLKATRAKTAPFILLPLEAGALGGDATPGQLSGLTRAADAIGLAYQVVDDLDDLAEGNGEFHPYHAWLHHQPPADSSASGSLVSDHLQSATLHRATRHALAALGRAQQQLTALSPLLYQALKPTIQGLQQRANHHLEALPYVLSIRF